ncbi:SpoIID/LytB domain-containing protein [Rubrobacter aplysinae]|uniref:SpoIID/LytB domain-containing protein n=1 Tax=Rubrobacter aplysinae TaxID=909625 RepID=UPI00069EDFB6|nr:SpoIID/LytB domain-containing protein [Rubrobacter aplysinae]
MDRLLGGMLAGVFASLVAVILAFGAAPPAEGATGPRVCGSGYGHGVGLSQYGAKGRAEAGQSFGRIIRTYYRGVGFKRLPNDPVRVLLGNKARRGAFDVVVRSGRTAKLRNVKTGGTVDLGPGRYRTKYVPRRDAYRVTDISRGRSVGLYTGPIVYRPSSGGPLVFRNTGYRGAILVRATGKRLFLINALRKELYLRGVVPAEMPASWEMDALKSQAVAARSFATATQRRGAFDFFDDYRDQAYGGASAETRRTNRAVRGTARLHAVYNGSPITAFFHSSGSVKTEDSAYVFGNRVPYLKSRRDVDRRGRAYVGRAHADSPWLGWSGRIDADGSPRFGVGSIQRIRVLDRSPSGRVTKIRVRGTEGATTVSGEQEIRFGLQSTGIRRNDGSTRPGGALPSARIFFGKACS